MAQDKVASLYDWIFRKLRYYTVYSSEATDALLAAEFADILAVNTDGKADKVAGATEDNFASLDDTGNLKDSGYSAANFASVSHTHDTRYLRLNEDNNYNSGSYIFTFITPNDTAPFAITQSGTPGVVVNLNADLLDGKHASEFAAAVHTHSKYALKDAAETITGPWTFSSTPPFALSGSAVNALVTGLNADKLDGNDASAFALASHSHAWGTITGTLSNQTDLNTALGLLLAKPTTGAADGTILVYNDPIVQTSGVDLSELALASSLALKADILGDGVEDNFMSFDSDGNIADSGANAGDFAAASHHHDDRYYTETEMTTYATAPKIGQGSMIGSDGIYIMGSDENTGAGTTPDGTIKVVINGNEYFLLTSATA